MGGVNGGIGGSVRYRSGNGDPLGDLGLMGGLKLRINLPARLAHLAHVDHCDFLSHFVRGSPCNLSFRKSQCPSGNFISL
jgi:hypothetical protein